MKERLNEKRFDDRKKESGAQIQAKFAQQEVER
jgi:hypothetical protein